MCVYIPQKVLESTPYKIFKIFGVQGYRVSKAHIEIELMP